jgi:glucosamine--fructose-6-phosphate aminotransferase (isomerizing)
MCGIFGFITTRGAGPDLAILKRIAAVTQRRGAHAFGLAWLDADNRLRTFKRPGAATDRLRDLDRCRDARIVVGHCRWATHGAASDNRNNHPHRAGRGWLVHNGVVFNHRRLALRHTLELRTACDSEVLGLLLARGGGSLLHRALAVSRAAEGPLALMGVWRNPSRLLLVRRGKPLLMGFAKQGVYFASLAEGLPGRVRRVNDDFAAVIQIGGGLDWRGKKLNGPRTKRVRLSA